MSEAEAYYNMPPKLTTNNLKKIECELCKQCCIPTSFRRHLFAAHSELSPKQLKSIFENAVSRKNPEELSSAEKNIEKHPLFSKMEPDGRIKCKAPDCILLVSPQNITRYSVNNIFFENSNFKLKN